MKDKPLEDPGYRRVDIFIDPESSHEIPPANIVLRTKFY